MLEIENNTFSILNSSMIMDSVYQGMGISINNQIAGLFIDNADFYTGKTSSADYLRTSLNENTAKQESVDAGLEMVRSNQTVLSQIMDKAEDIKSLADQAAAGGLTSGELTDLQDQVVTLQLEIDELAQGQLGKTSLLKEDGQETVAISTSLSVSIDKRDMTSDGLGLDTVDLTSDAAGAVDIAETAIADIESMETHLDVKVDSLEASQAVLDVQRTSLLAAQSAVEGIDSALAMVGALAGMSQSNVSVFIAAQANATTDAVLALLSNE